MRAVFSSIRLLLALSLSCCLFKANAQIPVTGHTRAEVTTSENGELQVFVPLNLPKGTMLQPSLALSYNNLGVTDFKLGDLFQAITLAPSTYATDGFSRGIEMDRFDRYALNGERLVANFCCTNSATGYLTLATDFRTEQETFTRVVPHVSFRNGAYEADSFTVYTKSGLLMKFGSTSNSKLPGIWLLNRITDRNSNYLTITYTINTINNEYQPALVQYTGNNRTGLQPYNKIIFNYENRPDTVTKYFAGNKVLVTKRLAEIVAYDHADLFRRYKLEYLPGTNASKLNKITEYGIDGSSYLKPVSFSWAAQPATPGFTKQGSGNWVGGSITASLPGDFTGDSKTDIISYAGSSKYFVSVNTGTGFRNETWLGNAGGTANIIADMNGDLRSDMIFVSNNKFYISISTGTSFQTSEWIGGNASGTGNFVVCDVNNDGRADLCRNGGNGKFIFNISTGNSFRIEIRNSNYTSFTGTPFVADLNNDGASDVFFNTTNGDWQLIISSGNSYWTATWKGPVEDMSKCVLADMNGDNMMDIVSKANSTDGNWNIYFSTAKGFVRRVWTGPVCGIADVKIADVNKNGLPDIIRKETTTTCKVWLNKGYTLESSTWQTPAFTGANYLLFEANGDGGIDLLAPISGTTWLAAISNAEKDVITKVTNGNGFEYSVVYAPLTDATVYTKGSTAVYPDVDLCAPFYVVKSFSTSDGVGGTHAVSFQYKNAKFNLTGRGFRGFEQVTRTDAAANTVLTSYYATDHQLIAVRTLKEETRTLNGTLLQMVENQVAINSYKLPVDSAWFSYYSRKTEHFYELNGSEYITKTTDYSIDVFGNPVTKREVWNNGYSVTTNNLYFNNINTWSIGRLLESSVTKSMPGKPVIIVNSAYTYDAIGNLSREILLPAHATRKLQTDYSYDKYGNATASTTSGPGVWPRTSIQLYDDDGRNVIASRNANGQTIQIAYKNGLPSLNSDENNLLTAITRDAFGRETFKQFPDGTYESTQYKNCQSCVAGAVYYVEVQSPAQPARRVFYDMLDRVIRKETDNFDGRKIIVSIAYNADGSLKSQSEPYFEGAAVRLNTYTYDAIKRLVTETAPGNRITTYTYNGLTKTITDAEGKKKTQIENPQGKPVSSIDNAGNRVDLEYNSGLNVVKLTAPKGKIITCTYDELGFKTSITDPDIGLHRYECNALGELTKQINAAGEIIVMEYDLLGRLSKRVEGNTETRYEYDAQYGKPHISRILVNGVVAESNTYHPNGKLYTHSYYLNGQPRTYTYFYNSLTGLLDVLTYPNNFAVKLNYTNGFLTELRNLAGNALLWRGNNYNEESVLTSFTLGNNLTTLRKFDDNTHFITAIQTGPTATLFSVQNLQYAFSATGNLVQRSDLLFNLKEDFLYDKLNQLTKAQVTGQPAFNFSYDELGNLVFRTELGNYKYGENGMGPQTLTSIDHGSVGCVYPLNQEISYTAFGYVSKVRSGNTEVGFNYWPDRSRQSLTLKKSGLLKLEKNYFGELYEESKDSTGAITSSCYLKANNEVFAVVTKRQQDAQQITYVHTDHLGSINAITSQTGQVLERYSFDAWGKRRNATTWAALSVLAGQPAFQKGFTFHESFAVDELVFTPSRVYSPLIGRFISADPFVLDMTDVLQLNRFAYVNNNPLKFIDPSGHFSLKKFFKSAIGIVVGLIVAPLMPVMFPAVTGFFSTVLSGAVAGFSMAFTSSLVNGQGLVNAFHAGFDGALWGGIKEGLTFGIGAALPIKDFSSTPVLGEIRAVIHGVSQGLVNQAQGGSFGQGFARGFIQENVKYARDEFVKWRESTYGNLNEEQLERTKASYRTAHDYPDDNFESIAKSRLMPIVDPDFPNVGKFPVTSKGLGTFFLRENGGFMSWIAKNVAGMNSMAVAHDYFATMMGELENYNPYLDIITNAPTIPIFTGIQYAALHQSQYKHGRIY